MKLFDFLSEEEKVRFQQIKNEMYEVSSYEEISILDRELDLIMRSAEDKRLQYLSNEIKKAQREQTATVSA